MCKELMAPSHLVFHVYTIKFDERKVISLLPILEQLIVELTPSHIEQFGSDELPMERRTNPRMFLETRMSFK